MKTKSILSSLILLVFAILGGGSVETVQTLFWVFIVGFVILVVVANILRIRDEEKKKERKELARLEREKKLQVQTEQYNLQKQELLESHGIPDKSIVMAEVDFNSEIHVFENAQKVFVLGKEYSFKDIISCTFSDNPRTIKGKVTAVTKSKNGNVIGRAIVGDVIAGPAGAIIGGTTAKKHTEYIQGDDKTEHDYTVIINVDSISEPVIRIHTGRDGKLTNEIVGLMNVIISRK